MRSLCALLLALVCLPAFAAGDCPAIKSLTAADAQTGRPVLIQWSYTDGLPLTQTITGHDFDEPVVLAPGQTSYVYVPDKPGEKHLQLTAVTGCGTVTQNVKYHVKQCNIVSPPLTTSTTRVDAGATFTASVDLEPGHTATWEVVNGTPSATTGSSITITAGNSGVVTVRAWISRGNSCSVRVSKTVQIVPPCVIAEPAIQAYPEPPLPNNYFSIYSEVQAGETLTYAVRGAEVMFMGGPYVDVWTPAEGSFEIDVIVSTRTCSRTFTKVYTVTPCTATATVMPASGDATCGITSIAAEFTGLAPWSGQWSDGEFFYTETPRIERQIVNSGTYTISYVYDLVCQGTVTGSVEAGPTQPAPQFSIDPMANGQWYGDLTCPGLPRTAQLTSEVPAGAQIVWSIDNGGTILGGQGTPQVQFAGGDPGQTGLTVTVTGANGCGRSTTNFAETLGTPEPTISVEPSTIQAGGTAIVTVNLGYFFGGFRLTSSLGDFISWNGEHYEYRSTHGGGVAVITVEAENVCGVKAIATTTLTIEGGSTPVTGTATVSGSGSNCSYTASASFTGTAPFSGTWSTGQTFTTDQMSTSIEVPAPGTYTLFAFSDANGPGTITGSATFYDGNTLPQPAFTIDQIVNANWYGNATCVGLERVARLDVAIPAGAQVEWTVGNATILSGQGTSEIHFAATAAGPVPVTAVFREGGCSQSYTYEYLLSYGKPQFEVTVEPSTIPLGGSGIITVRQLVPFAGGINVTSSLGDTIIPQGGADAVATWEYRSSTVGGPAVITVTQTSMCLETTTEQITVNIDASNPVPATAVVNGYGSSCDGYAIVATFTGVAPFSGTWSNGVTFSSDSPSAYLQPTEGGTYTITEFSDANGPGTVTGSATFDFVALPAPQFTFDRTSYCPGTTATATLVNPIPDGATVRWDIYGATIISGQGTAAVVFQGDGQYVSVNVKLIGPNACSPYAYDFLPPGSTPSMPLFDLYGVYVGGTTQFTVYLDQGTETWGMENSMGDPMEVVDSPSPNVYNVRYASTHGTGDSSVRVWSTSACGVTVENTRVMQVLPPAPTVTLTSTPDPVCGAILTATFTGAPPFTATWSDTGETFTTNDHVYTRQVGTTSMYVGLWNFRDANGSGNGSNYVLVEPRSPGYVNLSNPVNPLCAGTTATYSAFDVPAGWEVLWVVEQPAVAHIVSGQGTAEVVIAADAPGQFNLTAHYRTPNGCEGAGSGYTITVPETCP